MILPAAPAVIPTLRVHEGHEWIYVLTGQVRLLLDKQDLLLRVGDAIEFDTAVPHWFGSANDQPAEVLGLFGSQASACSTSTPLCLSSDHASPHQG